MRGRHIVSLSGIHYFDLRSDPNLALKNDNARRLIPVHQKILDIGFGHLLENLAADAQLFSELSNDNKNKNFSQSVNDKQIYVKNLKAMVDSIAAPIGYERLHTLAKPIPSFPDRAAS
ncbi:MAG TPA: hypothetical protein PKA55_02180 [Rhodoblastus sp.]|nr:hypothetical protein [Rhodoblastus sp.]